MQLFTISSGTVEPGVLVGTFTTTNFTIPAVMVGEDGRGRAKGVLPVALTNEAYAVWKEKGSVTIQYANVGLTQKGLPKLFQTEKNETDEHGFLAVFETKIGFRGGNSHTGDRDLEKSTDEKLEFLPFPATTTLVTGIISQGAAGNMGSGQQPICIMPFNVVFRTGYSGRMYGNPRAHYYMHNGVKLMSATYEERQLSDLF